MKQLGDLEKILSEARAIGENFQKELEALHAENESLQEELKELRDENKTLREENEKIYLEMNSLRAAKENFSAANDAFASNLHQLMEWLNETHQNTMTQINQQLNDGLKEFVADYVNKIRSQNAESTSVVTEFRESAAIEKYSAATSEVIIANTNAAVSPNVNFKKPKMQYSGFYAEESIAIEPDEKPTELKSKSVAKSNKK